MFAFYFSWQHKTLYLHRKLTAAIRLNINRLSTDNQINLPLVFNLKETKLFKSKFTSYKILRPQKCELPISLIVWSMDWPSHHQAFFIHQQLPTERCSPKLQLLQPWNRPKLHSVHAVLLSSELGTPSALQWRLSAAGSPLVGCWNEPPPHKHFIICKSLLFGWNLPAFIVKEHWECTGLSGVHGDEKRMVASGM